MSDAQRVDVESAPASVKLYGPRFTPNPKTGRNDFEGMAAFPDGKYVLLTDYAALLLQVADQADALEIVRGLHRAACRELALANDRIIAAERAREEACRMIAELRDYVVNERDAQVLPRKAASYQRELDSIDAFLAANGGG